MKKSKLTIKRPLSHLLEICSNQSQSQLARKRRILKRISITSKNRSLQNTSWDPLRNRATIKLFLSSRPQLPPLQNLSLWMAQWLQYRNQWSALLKQGLILKPLLVLVTISKLKTSFKAANLSRLPRFCSLCSLKQEMLQNLLKMMMKTITLKYYEIYKN